ncbi:hypothetical protein X743_32325 [Mesorhizobium sp. LNHC252B00]|nr:hypothetical protein X743_32325 [Mesorhizobium sp. LNHC252B00]
MEERPGTDSGGMGPKADWCFEGGAAAISLDVLAFFAERHQS